MQCRYSIPHALLNIANALILGKTHEFEIMNFIVILLYYTQVVTIEVTGESLGLGITADNYSTLKRVIIKNKCNTCIIMK